MTEHSLAPLLPAHRLAPPLDTLQQLHLEEPEDGYASIADALVAAKGEAGACQALIDIAQDRTYDSYYDAFKSAEEAEAADPRLWTRVHAICALGAFGPAAAPHLPALCEMLVEENDEVREAVPFCIKQIGPIAVDSLAQIIESDPDPDMRMGAAECLSEIGTVHPETRDRLVNLLRTALARDDEDPMSASMYVAVLMDLMAVEALPDILGAYHDERVAEEFVPRKEVVGFFREHAPEELDRVLAIYPEMAEAAGGDITGPDTTSDDEDFDVQMPYVAGPKVGRNDPCPCGSGQKYKKCCGK